MHNKFLSKLSLKNILGMCCTNKRMLVQITWTHATKQYDYTRLYPQRYGRGDRKITGAYWLQVHGQTMFQQNTLESDGTGCVMPSSGLLCAGMCMSPAPPKITNIFFINVIVSGDQEYRRLISQSSWLCLEVMFGMWLWKFTGGSLAWV